MEFLEIFGELLIALLDGGTLLADIISWIKGRDNRIERREARRRGVKVPPRDGWNVAVIPLTVTVVILTGYIMWGLWL